MDRNEHVLVVTSESGLRQELAEWLRARDYSVHAVPDGSSALHAARLKRPGVVIADRLTPGMSGFDLCRRLKSEPALASCYFLLLLAQHQPPADLPAQEMPDDFLTPPLSLHAVEARVRAGMRLVEAQRRLEVYHLLIENQCAPGPQTGQDHLDQMMAELIEMAAHLQAEILANAEREAERLQQTRAEAFAQAATYLCGRLDPVCRDMEADMQSLLRMLPPSGEACELTGPIEQISRHLAGVRVLLASLPSTPDAVSF